MTTDTMHSSAVIEALAIGSLPDVQWSIGDDLCDCIYQRIGMWTNPYLAVTHEIRLCCAWAKLYEMFPETVRTIPAFWDYNNNEWITEVAEWNGEAEMPKALWYRQLARKTGRSLADIRAEYAEKDELRPKGYRRPEPVPFVLLIDGRELVMDLRSVHFR